MHARRNWVAPADTRLTARRERRSPAQAVAASWRSLSARLRGGALAEWARDGAQRRVAVAASPAEAIASELAITRGRYKHGLHLLVSGQLDGATAEQLKRECDRVDAEAVETLVLDLGEVTAIDSSGLGVLFAAFARLGERLVIIISPPVAHTIHTTDARERLPIIEG